jgi:hypothetical protein
MAGFSGITDVEGTSLGEGLSICKGSVTDNNWSFSRVIILNKKGEVIRWSVDATMPTSFSLISVDFLGDGKFSPVLLNDLGWQNGTGINSCEVGVLSDVKNKKILFFDTENNPDDPENENEDSIPIFKFNKNRQRMEILNGEWTRYIGDYMYFVKRWFYFEKGELHPVMEKPVLKRGFGYLFAEWKDSGKTENCKKDPWLEDDMGTSEKVRIKNARIIQQHDYFAIKFQLETKMGFSEFIYAGDVEENKGNLPMVIDRLGQIETKRVFPSGYIPEKVNLWIGKKGSLETFKNKDPYTKTDSKKILWF